MKTILILTIMLFSQNLFGFDHSYKRVISGHDLIRLFQNKFPNAFKGAIQNSICQQIGPQNEGFVGIIKPKTGLPETTAPTLVFTDWFADCIEFFLKLEIDSTTISQEFMTRQFGAEANKYMKENNLLIAPKSVFWMTQIPAEIRVSIIRYRVHYLIGPGLLEKEDEFISKIMKQVETSASLHDAFLHASRLITLHPQFLTY